MPTASIPLPGALQQSTTGAGGPRAEAGRGRRAGRVRDGSRAALGGAAAT
ncbi:hypothetical protein [Actinacidiphila bryophytorum]|nr:hypothetical protein [Actinacidiphila bryophytorum]UWE12316.1 hypothetical protein NYE86_28925 [Actinacidiphila bryophytorum]